MKPNPKPREPVKDLKYWQKRGGQIEWRLVEAERQVAQMKRDLKECDDRIRELKALHGPREGES